ncbi:hypothetical protein AB433_09335 [Croceicoccus naphthovorans]|uniref:Cytochrome c-552/4 domain-containing protein n=2 Tax=Croceicoccus naphthovorans TaxID=1348774 RepID=A0A0G3XKG2_9SPHN|nr:hypothetical protein AB433_09335 [Croceicoccus naphthovorans]
MAAVALAASMLIAPAPVEAQASRSDTMKRHLGVASCAGSTCHGRSLGDGTPVRQDELQLWQEESSPTGAHSRAYRVLFQPRGQDIIRRLGLDQAGVARDCLGCHAEPGAARVEDAVGCESCHGAAGQWIAGHYTVGTTHERSVSQGMTDLVDPQVRANVCLDCHFGSDRQGQFAYHRIMGAGHPRISFELDLFSTLQQHWNVDADYIERKGRPNALRNWAVGQAEALNRSLALFEKPGLATDGMFPEFYFFDCHSCHRRIFDGEDVRASKVANPLRPIPPGYPPYNDENMIMLAAAVRVLAPDLTGAYDGQTRSFHAAMLQGRDAAVTEAGKMRSMARGLSTRFAGSAFTDKQGFAMLDAIASEAVAVRYTDYEGAVQSVMAMDTLVSGLVAQGAISEGQASALRLDINRAYAAVNDPNGFKPLAFRSALAGAVRSIRSMQ